MNIVVRIEALNCVGFLFLNILSWQFQMYVVFIQCTDETMTDFEHTYISHLTDVSHSLLCNI